MPTKALTTRQNLIVTFVSENGQLFKSLAPSVSKVVKYLIVFDNT
jgi:hypothetical protein